MKKAGGRGARGGGHGAGAAGAAAAAPGRFLSYPELVKRLAGTSIKIVPVVAQKKFQVLLSSSHSKLAQFVFCSCRCVSCGVDASRAGSPSGDQGERHARSSSGSHHADRSRRAMCSLMLLRRASSRTGSSRACTFASTRPPPAEAWVRPRAFSRMMELCFSPKRLVLRCVLCRPVS